MTEEITILNVDDQEALRYVKSRDLRQGGFTVIEARSGSEALRAVEAHQPPVVLLDVQLPDISGYEVCKYIKQRWPGVMIIMTSATFTSSADRTAGLDSGADSFLVQPAEPMELAAAINALVRIRRSEDDLRRINDTLEQRVQDRTADLAAANRDLLQQIEQRQNAEAALVQAEKMQAVGQLTGGLAHDFNNLLTAVITNLDLIGGRSTEPRIRQLANNALHAAERGAKLTSQLLAFSRTQKLTTAPVDVNALITGMHHLINQSLGANITVELKLDARLPSAMGDLNQLELAILNLAINGRDAMPQGGTLAITTALAASGQYVAIAIADTGIGMSPQTAARAFDPFYTTKPAGQGTGLGLSQVYGIAKQCGGDVTIASQLGVGTTVTIVLPRAETSAAATPRLDGTIALGPHSEKLLIVDDDGDVRSVISMFLSELGYDIRDAAHADQATAMLSEFAPDLVIMDFAMPDMNGAETALAIRRHCPGVPILFISGFADSEILDRAVGPAPILRKPFRPAQLAAAIRTALAERSSDQ